jgi:hypothetical protein
LTGIVAPVVAADPLPLPAPVHYEDQAVVVATKGGVAVFKFAELTDKKVASYRWLGRKYTYRLLPADGGKEQRGEGEVYEQLEGPDGGVLRSKNALEAGPVVTQWSWSNWDRGYICFAPDDPSIRVYFVSAEGVDELELKRFALNSGSQPSTSPSQP